MDRRSNRFQVSTSKSKAMVFFFLGNQQQLLTLTNSLQILAHLSNPLKIRMIQQSRGRSTAYQQKQQEQHENATSESERAQRERLRDLAVFERLNGNPAQSSPSLAVKKSICLRWRSLLLTGFFGGEKIGSSQLLAFFNCSVVERLCYLSFYSFTTKVRIQCMVGLVSAMSGFSNGILLRGLYCVLSCFSAFLVHQEERYRILQLIQSPNS